MKVIEKRDDTQNGLRAYAFAPVKMVNLIKAYYYGICWHRSFQYS